MRLSAWIPLDWVRAYLMLDEIEESAKAGIELLPRAVDAQAPHSISPVKEHLINLEEAGYTEIDEVQHSHYELNKVTSERDKYKQDDG